MTRSELDERGLLREDADYAPPAADACFTVFAQRADARVELASWRQQAERFFSTTVGLAAPKRYDAGFPRVDLARVVIAPSSVPGGTRAAYSRPATEDDWWRAEQAEIASVMGGMGALARRCKQVWLVEREGADDRTALLLAAILASVLLGPVVADGAIFGVRGARERLMREEKPYR